MLCTVLCKPTLTLTQGLRMKVYSSHHNVRLSLTAFSFQLSAL